MDDLAPAAEPVADDRVQASEPVVVGFPAELDVGNAGDLAKQLRAAIAPGAAAVVADLTTTVFCDSSGLRIIVLAHDWARADSIELRLAVPPGPTLVVMKLVGLDQLLPIYPSLDQALAGEPSPRETPRRGDRALTDRYAPGWLFTSPGPPGAGSARRHRDSGRA